MSVKITGIRKLDANYYNKIVIREIDNNYIVNVSGEKLSKDSIASTYKLSNSFRNIKDKDKILMIVDSFLFNARINNIDMSVLCIGYSGLFIKIDGNRKLYLQIEDKKLLKDILKMVKDKYNKDRYQYCSNNNDIDLYNILLDDKVSSFDRQFIPCSLCAGCEVNKNCEKYIEFKLMLNGNKLVGFDKDFIYRFIVDKLWEIGKEASVFVHEKNIKLAGGESVGRYVDAYYIICRDFSVRFECGVYNKEYIFSLCSEIVSIYNNELNISNDMMRKQLKMEGF